MRTRSLFLSLPMLAAIGCGVGTPITSITQPELSNGIQGKMFGGQQPVVGSTIGVYAMNTTSYGATPTLLGSTVLTNSGGGFTYGAYTCPANNPPVYIMGQGGNAGSGYNSAIVLVAGIGNCNTAPNVFANINEVTTAATAFALSHFFSSYLGGGHDYFGGTATTAEGNNAGLVEANLYTIPLLVSIPSGFAKNTSTTGTTTITLETAKLNSIANTLAACVNSSSSTSTQCTSLFTNTTAPGSSQAPSDVLQAATQMALYPYQNVTTLYNLASASSPFAGLASAPTDWTLGVSYTSTAHALSIAGTSASSTASTIDIDATGRVWFPTNKSTAHGVAYFDPSTSTFSPIYATGVTSPQYVAIDTSATPLVYVTDSASNKMIAVSTAAPSAAGTTTYTIPNSTKLGPVAISFTAAGTSAAGATAPALNNAVLVAAATSASSTGQGFYEVDATNTTPTYQAPYMNAPNGIAAYTYMSPPSYYETEASTSGTNTACRLEGPYADGLPADTMDPVYVQPSTFTCFAGGVAQVSQGSNETLSVDTNGNLLCSTGEKGCFNAPIPTSLPVGIAVDGDRQIWLANSGNSSIVTFNFATPDNYTKTSTLAYSHTATMPMPYGIAIDRSGNVWVSNAGCVSNSTTACTPGNYVLSELIGAAAPTLTPLAAQFSTTSTDAVRPAAAPAGPAHVVETHNGRARSTN